MSELWYKSGKTTYEKTRRLYLSIILSDFRGVNNDSISDLVYNGWVYSEEQECVLEMTRYSYELVDAPLIFELHPLKLSTIDLCYETYFHKQNDALKPVQKIEKIQNTYTDLFGVGSVVKELSIEEILDLLLEMKDESMKKIYLEECERLNLNDNNTKTQ